jgi:flagellar hook-basal body complex protein FliE
MTQALAALRAYQSTQTLPLGTTMQGATPAQAGFQNQLTQFLGQATRDVTAFDQSAAAMAHGKADLVQMVHVIQEAEAALETMVAMRDKVVQAYEEVMRMTI